MNTLNKLQLLNTTSFSNRLKSFQNLNKYKTLSSSKIFLLGALFLNPINCLGGMEDFSDQSSLARLFPMEAMGRREEGWEYSRPFISTSTVATQTDIPYSELSTEERYVSTQTIESSVRGVRRLREEDNEEGPERQRRRVSLPASSLTFSNTEQYIEIAAHYTIEPYNSAVSRGGILIAPRPPIMLKSKERPMNLEDYQKISRILSSIPQETIEGWRNSYHSSGGARHSLDSFSEIRAYITGRIEGKEDHPLRAPTQTFTQYSQYQELIKEYNLTKLRTFFERSPKKRRDPQCPILRFQDQKKSKIPLKIEDYNKIINHLSSIYFSLLDRNKKGKLKKILEEVKKQKENNIKAREIPLKSTSFSVERKSISDMSPSSASFSFSFSSEEEESIPENSESSVPEKSPAGMTEEEYNNFWNFLVRNSENLTPPLASVRVEEKLSEDPLSFEALPSPLWSPSKEESSFDNDSLWNYQIPPTFRR